MDTETMRQDGSVPEHLPPYASRAPTGMSLGRRVPLWGIIPELGDINWWVYSMLRFACCGRKLMKDEHTFTDCEHCHDNRGYVCPTCLGATYVLDLTYAPGEKRRTMRCPGCCRDALDEKGKVITTYDAETELESVRKWLIRYFPLGVPIRPTYDDLVKMVSLKRSSPKIPENATR